MKTLALIAIVPSLVSATTIPVDDFDQAKLLELLRRIPGTVTREETSFDYHRRHYRLHPKDAPFVIACMAEYYQEVQYPSGLHCGVEVSPGTLLTGEEFRFELKDPAVVNSLFSAMDSVEDRARLFSNERLWALSWEKKHRQVFRFAFRCDRESCVVTFLAKAP